ncbi:MULTISPECIES: hypothetical protein [Dietzia]|uniref:Uncharacterized protein n=3 Tax=Dietzia TaxID=37914 RepID=A0AAW5Q8A1_9ACTN|nr:MULTISPECIES: hypothetical protein [Dietzia]MBB0993689.1 hypothetical protein [Dietzia sp. SLG510A3-40A3]MBB1009534.1 hypothetical protein [Dietzia sp. SLG510A3-3B2-2]AVM64727.1 hypothetical protein C3V38_10435 [Dietzia sp. oral taxon 368]KZO57730.1 hypothetical protein A2U19_15795 [Dietzia maris]MBB0997818.1 hypothetical protein [Dietzia maris]
MSDFERNKDQVQAGVQAGASLVGRIAVIVTDAVGSIAKEIGDFVTEGIEMREAARISRREERQRTADEPLINLDGIEDGDLQG